MDFDLTEEQRLVRRTVREFAEAEIAPGAAARDEEAAFPSELIPKLASLNFMGILVPEAYGGACLDLLSAAIIVEEIARVDGSLALTVASHNSLSTSHILRFGSEEQKRRFLNPLARGEMLGAWALTEPQAGSDASAVRTSATLDGNAWVLNGSKMFITHGSVAGLYVVIASTSPEKGAMGLSAFVIERGTAGLTSGRPEKKLGVRSSDTAPLFLEQARVPAENLIGKPGAAYAQVREILKAGRVLIGAMAVGLAEAALDAAMIYAKGRAQFGTPISQKGAIQSMIADMATETEAARLMVYRAAWLAGQGQPFGVEASMAKLYASEAAARTTQKALQIHGGYGYLKDHPVERFLRDARVCEIGEGTSEIQRIIIARRILHGA